MWENEKKFMGHKWEIIWKKYENMRLNSVNSRS